MTTQTARKGDPGHLPEARERTGRTETGRERNLRRRIRLETDRGYFAEQFAKGMRGEPAIQPHSFFGYLEKLYAQRFGDYALAGGRGKFASATKSGAGRRAVARVIAVGAKLRAIVRRGHKG